MIYVYPKLPAKITTSSFRIAGNGLANCLFIYARAISLSKKNHYPMLSPTWFNLSLGPYIRKQADKRHYIGLFNRSEEISGLKKFFILCFYKHIKEKDAFNKKRKNSVIIVAGLSDYYLPFISDYRIVSDYIISHVNQNKIQTVLNYDFSNCAAVHIRLGDYTLERRVPMDWYIQRIRTLLLDKSNLRILVFSDGKDEELKDILDIDNAERVFFGNAIADIIAMSKCDFLIGSDSTFSAWAAFLGQVPCVFYRLKSKPVLFDNTKEIIDNG